MKKFTLLIFVSLLSICGYAQMANESFESPWVGSPAAPPGPPGLTNWTVVNEQGAAVTWVREITSQQKPSHTGDYSAYLDHQNVSPTDPLPKDWLITPYINMPANAQLRFFSRLTTALDQGGIYKVKISTDPNPANLASYTDLQTWTELSLNPVQTDYYEKVITLPAITGSVHIAFVLEGDNSDRWLIDDVKVVAQCTDPTTLTTNNITMTTAQFNWVNTGGATSWEIEVVPDTVSPTGTGLIYNGAPPYTKTNLTAGTIYKAYIRAICSDGGNSGWIGPVFFTTAKLGESCSYPLVVTPLPFTTTSNTSNFADNYEGSPGTTCGTTATYLSGNDVVYEYTPTITGNLNISTTNTTTGAAMFVYDNCADIGVACIGGGIGNVTIPSLAVTAGNTIYIVISSSTAITTTPYTLSIQQVFCAAPTALAAANITPTTAELSWGAGTATAWQLAVQPSGTGLPTGSGINVTQNTSLPVSSTSAGVAFTPSTCYEYYVRASCGDGNYSIWTGPFAFCTPQIPAGITYTQDWETTPNNWTFNNGTQANKWVVGGATSNGGSQSLYISNDNGLNNTYSINSASVVQAYRDVVIPVGATSLNLAFDWKSVGEAQDYIRAYLIPITVNPVAGTQLVGSATNIKIGGDLTGSGTWSAFNGVVNVTGLGGTTRRLVLEWRNTATIGTQSPAAIDNINLSVITCPAPSNPTVVAGTLTSNSVNISWTAPTSIPANGYNYYVSTSPTAPTATTTPTNSSATTTATGVVIQPSLTHYFWVRANCGPTDTSTWTGPLIFIAPQIPAGLDYSQNFDLGPHGWALSNGTQQNKWVVGTAVNNSATSSLYVSNDNGATNSYNNNSLSAVHAYRDITIPAGADQLELSFDWKCVAESTTFDWIKVWLAPVTFNPTPGTSILAANATQIGTALSLNANWTNQTNIIQASSLGMAGTTRRLIFEWRNDGSQGEQPPAAIDNINFRVIPCPQPSALTMTSLTMAQAVFSWTAPVSGATGYDYYLATDSTVPTAATVPTGTSATNSLTLSSLPPSTSYCIWVRNSCSATSKSYWVGPVCFITPQIPAPINYTQNFDAGPHGWDFVNGTQANKWVVGSAVSNSPANSMYISNDNGVSNAYTLNSTSIVHAYRDLTFPALVDQVLLSFDWKGIGEVNLDYFKIWIVPTSYIPAAGTAIVAGTGRTQVGANFQDNSIWQTSNTILPATGFQGQTMRLVFEWRNSATGGTQPPAAIDNINFKVVSCPAPTNLLMPSNTSGGVTFTWTPPSSVSPTFDYYYTTSQTPPGATTTPSGNVPTPSVTLSGLPVSSNYYFWVRDNCGPGDTSLWLGPFEFSTVLVPVNLNYNENFDGDAYGWIIKNSTQTNKWVVGTAVSNGTGKSLYVSNNGGATHTYTITAGSVVHAYKDFIVPAGANSLNFNFDWKNLGQSAVDYIKVWRVPNTFVPTTGTLITTAADRELLATLSNNANWTTASYTLNSTAYAGTTTRIIFEWRNDTFTGTQPPGAIDNVELSIITCPKPTALGATAVTQTGATFNWTEAGTASNWEVYVVPATQPAPTATSTGVNAGSSTFVYTTPALQPSTNYVYYVRAVCGTNDKSKWSGPFAFKTAIGNDECTGAYTIGVNAVNQDCQLFATAMYTGATPSPQPFNCGGINGADIWYQFVATTDRANIELSAFDPYDTTQPVVIELYQGEVCGSLLQVDCGTTNVLMAKNLVVGATYKVRLYISAATPNLATTFTVCINTPDPQAGTGQEACTITTINNSFETPVVTGQFPNNSIDHNSVQGWRTTATDEKMEFWPVPNYEFVPSYEGNQFVELNANLVAALYQDYETPAGTVFTYTFGHRGRQGTDTCELRAGPPGGPFTTVATATTGNTAWVTYTGTYTTPPGQPITRFVFQSVSAAGGVQSVGNFLDGIKFTADNSVVSVSPTALTCIDNVTTVVAAGTGEWGALPDNPAETIINDPQANTTTISGFTANGTYRYSWTTPYCSSVVEVTYDNGSVPEPVVVATIDYCQDDVAAVLSATALPGNTLNWYTTATGGTADTTAPTPDTSTTNTTIYYVSQQTAVNCESPRTSITVTVHPIPAAPVVAATAIEYCEDTTATQLAATALAGHTLNWYTVPTGGTADATAPTPVTATANVTSYYVSQTSAFGCESDRTEIIVTVNASIIPVTDFTLISSICAEDANPIPVPATGHTAGGYYSSQAGLLINPATGEIDLDGSTAGTYTVTYTILANPAVCNIGNTTSREITIVPLATAVTGFSYTTPVCTGTASQLPVLDAGFTAGGTFTADNGLVIDATTGEINIAASNAGDYIITYTVDQSVPNCMGAGTSTANLTITQVFTPVTGFDYANSFCFGAADASPNLAANFTAGGTFTATSGLVIDATTGVVNIAASTSASHTVTYTTTADPANCILGGSSSYTFTIGSELEFGFNGECEGTNYVVTASPANGSFDDNDPSVSFRWTTAAGAPIGTDSYILNVTEYANSTPENDTFPMALLLTVTVNGCETTRPYTVEDIACSIQKGISPNNDGLNDYFDLEFMGVKKLSIFNRYGQEVYTKGNYKNEWYGQGSNGDELPTGTYYYVIDRSAGGTNTGWIYINRQD